ncbi:MAG TPA: hypothetical protein VMS01_14130 [Stellaceae bacterium]|jgi:hypothetical protein|nr:hypothetical protein [Stellaceae bacterium]
MSLVLTEKSSLVCANHGAVQLTATQSKLTVAGAKVLVTGDLASAPISGCLIVPVPPPPGPVSAKCLMIASAAGGVSAKLKVAGKGVLLETVQGTTSGLLANVVQTWSVQSAGQSKLKAP